MLLHLFCSYPLVGKKEAGGHVKNRN